MPDNTDLQTRIFQAIKSRLLAEIPVAHLNNTYFDDQPLPKDPPPEHDAFIICVDDGRFDPEWGGNLCALDESTSFTVTHMRKFQVDRAKQLSRIIAEDGRNMLKMKRDLLVAMLVDNFEGAKVPWQPMENGQRLFDSLHPQTYIAPKRHKDWPFLYHYLEFKFTFYWDL